MCHCERVTGDEIAAACSGALPAHDIDGLRRRTRAVAGRCQGFHCIGEVCALAAATDGRTMAEWLGTP